MRNDHDPTDWARLAMDARTCLDLLGEDPPRCLLGGPGGDCHPEDQHAAATLGALRALVQDVILRLPAEVGAAVLEGHRTADDMLHGGVHTRQRPPGGPPGARH
jgi:hypothetical protein